MDTNALKSRFVVIFGVLVVYLLMGSYFKHNVGVWMATVWYLLGIAAVVFAIYNRYYRKDARKKVVNAEIIKR